MDRDSAFTGLLAEYKALARKKRRTWKLTADQFRRLTQEPCHFCHLPPSVVRPGAGFGDEPYVHGQVGRIDNAAGFTLDNSIPCCQVCCNGKEHSTYGEHLEWLHRIIAFQALKHVETPGDLFGSDS